MKCPTSPPRRASQLVTFLLTTLICLIASTGSSVAQQTSNQAEPDPKICISKRAFLQCEKDARAVLDATPEKVRACQRELDRCAGARDQAALDYQRRETHHLLLLDIKKQEVDRLEQTLKRRYTLTTLIVGIAAAGVAGYAVGRIHQAVRD